MRLKVRRLLSGWRGRAFSRPPGFHPRTSAGSREAPGRNPARSPEGPPHRPCLPIALLLCLAGSASAQTAADLKGILERLDRLERENRELREEVRELRERLGPPPEGAGNVTERLEVVETRVQEQAQTKVESSQKFPIRITGMALFNLFHNGRHSSGLDVPVTASIVRSNAVAGATFRQSTLGFEFQGPGTVFGAEVRGSLITDFFDSLSEPSSNPVRLRVAELALDWKTRSVSVAYEKAIFNPRNPTSLMMVGVTPLTGAGNLWRWQPQVRFEQRVALSDSTALRATVGVLQTSEDVGGAATPLEKRRPGLEGRFELAHKFDDARRIEIAPGFHASTTHAAGASVTSNLFSVDWFVNPARRIEFTGFFFRGQNLGHFGGLRQGFRVIAPGRVIPVHLTGGWAQLTLNATQRLSFNLMAGQEDPRNGDLLGSGPAKNLATGGNAMVRIAPNVIVSLEALRTRTTWIGTGNRLNNRYDLAVAYLF